MKNLSTRAKRTVIGASMSVVAVGAAVGAAGFASAAPTPTPTPTAPSSGAAAPAQPGPGGRGHGQQERGQLAQQLAGKLGLDRASVATALKKVREAKRSATKPTPTPGTAPTPREPAVDDAALAKALAPELGVDEAKIKTALDEIRAARAADRTKTVDDRLAAAVKAGTLTQAEADAVKKAAERGVITIGGR